MSEIIKRFEKAGVKVVISGHEHQFQHSRANNIDYLITGGAGQLRTDTPDQFAEARTVSWAATYHFLLVTVNGKSMTVQAIGQLNDEGKLVDIERTPVNGSTVTKEITINLP